MLAVSSALATDYTFAAGSTNATDSSGNIGATFTANTLTINADGQFSFASDYGAVPDIDAINFSGAVGEAVLLVPTPTPDQSGQGTGGTWAINWPEQANSQTISYTNRLKFSIQKQSANSAILANAFNWDIPSGVDFTLDVPLRVNASTGNVLGVTLVVRDGATMTFGSEAEIFADSSIQNYPTGYTTGTGTYTIQGGGELIIRNTWALRGSKLTVTGEDIVGSVAANKRATLTLDLPAGTVHDLRGRVSTASDSTALEVNNGGHTDSDGTSPAYDNSGASLFLTGPTVLNVLSDITLYGQIDSDAPNTSFAISDFNNMYLLTKAGAGKLTLDVDHSVSASDPRYLYERRSIPKKIEKILVEGGTLEFLGMQTWQAGGGLTTYETPEIIVAAGAKLIVGKQSIEDAQNSGAKPVKFSVYGEAEFEDHAIVRDQGNEIYPYEDYISYSNGLVINAKASLYVSSGGKVIVKDGALAVAKLTGEGDVEIRNTLDSRDRAVLILTDSLGEVDDVSDINDSRYAHNYIDFQGRIYGQGANVGLYSSSASKPPFSRRIFRSADVTLDNLIVYGPAQLNVDDAAMNGLANVKDIWLRGHRPGAVNFNDDGTVASATAYSNLTVGKLNFIPSEKAKSNIYVDGLKVDGTSNANNFGEIRILDYDNDTANASLVTTGANNAIAGQAPRDYTSPENREGGEAGSRVNVYISSLQLYANRGTNQDFPTAYANPASGIYALKINGTAQPSRFIIDGPSVNGGGLAEDVSNIVYQVQISESSDVRFTGLDGADYYPLARSNSLLVKKDAKLEIERGGIIDGHLLFEAGSIGDAWPDYGSEAYPADEDFSSNDGWYSSKLANYTAFTTQAGITNRITYDSNNYAVKVTGNIGTSDNIGMVLVRTSLLSRAFNTYEYTTIGQRFKVLGRFVDTNGTFDDNFAPSYNEKFQLRIPSDAGDVTVENRTELAVVEHASYSFISDPSNFGSGNNFSIKIPFAVMIRGESRTLKRETASDGTIHYYVDIGDEGRYYFKLNPCIGITDDVLGAKLSSSTYADEDVTLRAEIEITNDGEQYIRIVGVSRVEETSPIGIALYLEEDDELDSAGLSNTLTWLNGSFPAYTEYSFSRGSANPYSPGGTSIHLVGTMTPDDTLIAGRTYFAAFSTDISSPVTWTITDNTEGKVIHHSSAVTASDDLFIVELTPQTSEEEQSFTIYADNGSLTNSWQIFFDVDPEDEGITFQTLPATSGTHDNVKPGYRVNFPSNVVADEDSVFCPYWLKVITNDDGEVTGVEFNDNAPDFEEGITATVTVEGMNYDGYDVYYQWEVTYGVEGTASTGVSVMPAAPSGLDLSNPSVVQAIFALFGGRYADLPLEPLSLAGLTPRSPSDVPAAIRNEITGSGRRIGLVLPTITATTTGIKLFALDMSALVVGEQIFMRMGAQITLVSSGFIASATEDDYFFIDSDINQITTVPSAGTTVYVAAGMEAGNTYEPIVTVADSPSLEDEDNNSGGGENAQTDNTSTEPSYTNYNPYADYSPTRTPAGNDDDSVTPASNDVTPPASNDVTPTSSDITPTSNDVTPASNDITPTSGDTSSPVNDDTPNDEQYLGEPYNADRWTSASRISTAAALLDLLSRINSGTETPGQYYVLYADIDISALSRWTAIGTNEHPFTGHFDGAGKTITRSEASALFGVVKSNGVAIRNLSVRTVGSTNTSGYLKASASPSEYAGGIAQSLSEGIIENCSFSGNVSIDGEDSAAGGIVGELTGGTIRNCRVLSGSGITADYSAGGIAGYVSGGGISECSSRARVSARYSGGIAGYSEAERNSINSNSFTEADYEVGNDASSLELTPSSQTVEEGSEIRAITFSAEGIRSWSYACDISGLSSSDNAITGIIPYGTPAGNHTVIVNAINSDGTRIAGQAAITVTRISRNGSRNFMDYAFEMPEGLRDGIVSFFGTDNVYQLTRDEIISETWELGQEDIQAISGMNLRVVMRLPEIRPARSGIYLLRLSLLDVSAGARLGLQGITGSSQVNSAALEDMEYAFFDENGREIKEVPSGKVVYAALRLSAGRTHRGVVTAPNELGLGSIQAFVADDELLGKIAESVNISADKLNMLEEENIHDPQDPTQSMLDEMRSRESDVVGKMNTLVVSKDGYYVFKVTLSDDLYEQYVKGVKVEDLKAYVLYDSGTTESSEVRASFILGLVNTWEMLTLTGEKLEFGAKEFLMVGFLNAGTPFSVYLTKLIIALLMGGCDAGLGLAGLGVVSGAVILTIHRRR